MVRGPYISTGGEGYLAWIASLVFHVAVGLLVISDISFLSSPAVYVEAPLVVEFVEVTNQTTAPRSSGKSKPRRAVSPSPSRVQEKKPTVTHHKKQKPVTLPPAPEKPSKKRETPQPLSKAIVEKKKDVSVSKKTQTQKNEKETLSQVNNDDAFDDLVGDIEALREQILESEVSMEKQEKSVEDKSDQDNAKISQAPLSDRPTVSEIDALRSQVERHWVVDPGMKGAEEMEVSLQIRLERDGSVTHIEIMEKERYKQDSAYRAMVESARRAVYRAQPLEYPVEKYNLLKTVVLVFRPPTLQSSF